MVKVLVTGATGNVGREVIANLLTVDEVEVVAGVRYISLARKVFPKQTRLNYVFFDFTDPETYDIALEGIDRVFLLRPPHLTDVDTCFRPFLESMAAHKIREIVFMSVMGVEKSRLIPHAKIERLIAEAGFDSIMLRPSYFMQNLTTVLLGDIKKRKEIFLPAGRAKFNWIDVRNVGEAAAFCLRNFEQYRNQTFTIMGNDTCSFDQVAALLQSTLGWEISYRSANPISFYRVKKKEGLKKAYILIILILHLIPRFSKPPARISDYAVIMNKDPYSLQEFIEHERNTFFTDI
jgi:uncharacterized protein YbjT (DUF2867 family)